MVILLAAAALNLALAFGAGIWVQVTLYRRLMRLSEGDRWAPNGWGTNLGKFFKGEWEPGLRPRWIGANLWAVVSVVLAQALSSYAAGA
ncbi:hypothetical protein ACQ5SO_08460 [Rhodovulum sp. DZ06]|uniref:hypothetical protein n=1 Tax=Rhodovulum sp. DZ06 TaxID=3425126 RepID=UPI003D32CDC3